MGQFQGISGIWREVSVSVRTNRAAKAQEVAFRILLIAHLIKTDAPLKPLPSIITPILRSQQRPPPMKPTHQGGIASEFIHRAMMIVVYMLQVQKI